MSPMSVSTQELENPLQNSTSKISSSTDYGSISERLQPKRRSSASPLNSRDTIQVHEETSLLYGSRKQTMTPLPWGQVLIVLLLQVCEPLTSMSISPYVNQLVGELDIIDSGYANDHQVGYYAGLIMSSFFVFEALTVLHWSRLSDHVGRKPILLLGLFGTTLSMICFGLSRTFWALVISRCLCGLLNGNVGVAKSVMGELTDASNRAKGFPMMTMVWATGTTLGPLIGGTLARPAERFPNAFKGTFWKEYPYFLPCFVTAVFVFIIFGITLIFLKETVPKSLGSSASLKDQTKDQPVAFRQLLIYPVILSITNYTSVALLNIALDALLPLFLAMPLSAGGLGFAPHTIGYIIGSYGAFSGILQALLFPTFVRIAGVRRVFITGVAVFLPIFALFPIMSLNAREFGVNAFTWVCISSIIGLMTLMDMSYGCIFMYITSSTPNKRSLGATNGLSQTTVSIGRAIGPSMATSLFALSVEHRILGGYGVYAILLVLSCCAVYLGLCLPHEVWKEAEENDD